MTRKTKGQRSVELSKIRQAVAKAMNAPERLELRMTYRTKSDGSLAAWFVVPLTWQDRFIFRAGRRLMNGIYELEQTFDIRNIENWAVVDYE